MPRRQDPASQPAPTVAPEVHALLDEIELSLGSSFVASVLFGSRSRGTEELGSDTDVLVLVADTAVTRSEYLARSLAGRSSFQLRLALNVLSVAALDRLLEQGDPFALAILRDGRCMAGDHVLWQQLQNRYPPDRTWPTDSVGRHLESVASYHRARLLRSLHEAANDLQRWLMARAQKDLQSRDGDMVRCERLVSLADWSNLQVTLGNSTEGTVLKLITLHKRLAGDVISDLTELVDSMKSIGDLRPAADQPGQPSHGPRRRVRPSDENHG